MKFFRSLLVVLVLNGVVTYGLLYYFVLSKYVTIPEGKNVQQDIILKDGGIVLEKGSSIKGKLSLDRGDITIRENVVVGDGIFLGAGHLIVEKNVQIHGNVQVKQGEVSLAENVVIDGNLELPSGSLQKHSSAKITGEKPAVYITSDWPEVLAYFDILPEEHKEAVGYIFLTKDNNTIIRDPEIKDAHAYFDGVYFYKNHQLQTIGLEQEDKTKKYYDRAKAFFGGLPERKLSTHGIGATTKNYAQDQRKADIYIPSSGSRYTFIHEMGHVLDFKENFSDFHNPLYPFISTEIAVNGYGATHPGEDFAEGYRYYVLSHEHFQGLIQEKAERQEKYDFLKKYVFKGKEYVTSAPI